MVGSLFGPCFLAEDQADLGILKKLEAQFRHAAGFRTNMIR
jgi:hypothetical protein